MALNKKADANMWWIIIGAVIALVVMIILMVMFTGKTRPLEGGLSNCEGKGGICISTGTPCPQKTLKSGMFECQEGGVCCLGSPKNYDEYSGTEGCLEPISDLSGGTWCK